MKRGSFVTAALVAVIGCDTNTFDPEAVDTEVAEIEDPREVVDTGLDSGTPPERKNPWPCYGRTEVDVEADGSINDHIYTVYNPDLRDQVLHVEGDPRDDGRIDYTEDYVYDTGERLTRYTFDQGAEGQADYVETWTYNEPGQEVEYTEDVDGDGVREVVRAQVYNDNGFVVLRTLDTNDDGVIDSQRRWTRLDDGVVVSYEDDEDGDGVYDIFYTVNLDDQDRYVLTEGVRVLTKELVYRWAMTYEAVKGKPELSREINTIDLDGDGTVDQTFDYTFTPERQFVSAYQDANGDGIFERQWYDWTYDEADRNATYTYQALSNDGSAWFIYALYWVYENPTGVWEQEYGYDLVLYDFDGNALAVDGYVEHTTYECP